MLILSEKQKKNIFRYFEKYADKYINILKDFEISINKDNIVIDYIHFNIKKVYDFSVYNTYEKVKSCLYEYAKDFIKEYKSMRYTLEIALNTK